MNLWLSVSTTTDNLSGPSFVLIVEVVQLKIQILGHVIEAHLTVDVSAAHLAAPSELGKSPSPGPLRGTYRAAILESCFAGPVSGSVTAVQDLPKVRNLGEDQSALKSNLKSVVAETKPFDFVLVVERHILSFLNASKDHQDNIPRRPAQNGRGFPKRTSGSSDHGM